MYVELCPWAAGYEINVSCPNIAAGGAAMGSSPEGASSVMAACRKVTDKPLFVKMAPVNVAEIAKALEAAGADGLSVINSIQGMAIDVHTRKSRVAKPKGGLSGPLCHHIAVRMVWEVAQAVDIPINGVGGVMTARMRPSLSWPAPPACRSAWPISSIRAPQLRSRTSSRPGRSPRA